MKLKLICTTRQTSNLKNYQTVSDETYQVRLSGFKLLSMSTLLTTSVLGGSFSHKRELAREHGKREVEDSEAINMYCQL